MKRALVAAGLVVALGGVSYGIAAAVDTSSSSCSSTPNADGTVTCTIQASVDVTPPTQTTTETQTVTTSVPVPGPTTTTTVTVTATPSSPTPPPPPPPTTTTPPAPPPGAWAIGEGVNATNTGYTGDGVTASQLAPVSGSYTTYDSTFNGQTITLKAYAGEVDITGSHITIKDCSLTQGGLNSVGFLMEGSYNTVEDCTITSPAGESMYEPIWIFGDHNSVLSDDISRGDNLLTTYGTNVTITGSYLHDAETASDPGDHPDAIEIYGGGPTVIQGNRIHETDLYDSSINEAPWGNYKVSGLLVQDNFIDNGQSMTLIDNQNTSCGNATQPVGNCLINTRILGNAFGGHTNPDTNMSFGYYKTLENYEGRPIAQDDATEAANPNDIEWPTSGPQANKWEETQVTKFGDPALTPDRDGQIALPTCPDTC